MGFNKNEVWMEGKKDMSVIYAGNEGNTCKLVM